MWSNRSTLLRPVRLARLSCEILEGRFLLSAGFLGSLSDAANGLDQPGHYTLLVKDLVGDGQNDVVTASEDDNNVSVQTNSPNLFATVAFFHSSIGVQTTIPTPAAVALGDLTGNGIDDMIVCDKSENRVFIYLGLGGGRFGPELNGGEGLYTGISPDAVAMISSPDGSGREVVVANAGSNDVAIFQAQETPSGCTLVLKGRAHVGSDPTSVLVQDLSGQGTPDLVVTNAGDNTVAILPGTPGGLFDESAARILHTGDRPVQALVGNFDGQQDLLTVDSGSNDVTFFSNVASASTASERVPTGGIEPVAALAQDDTGTGRSDLIVANYGDSRVTLLAGTASGLQMSQSIQETGLHPAALASGSGMSPGSFYVLNAEQPAPTVMQFNVSATLPTAGAPADTPGQTAATPTAATPADTPTDKTTTTGGPLREEEVARSTDWLVPGRTVGTDLQPLTPSAVAVVPGVALRPDVPHPAPGPTCVPGGTAQDDATPPTAPAPAPAPAPGNPVSSLAGDEHPSVQRFILGVDEEPPPRIGPEGGSMVETESEPAPETRPAMLDMVLGAPSLPLPEWQELVETSIAAGAGGVPELNVETKVQRPVKTLVVLAAAGVMLGWRWRKDEGDPR
jgi:hypothetical protein